MWAHPGKKLLFMGCEFGQWTEWRESQSLDWHLFLGDEHAGLQRLVGDLNRLYTSRPALHALDHQSGGFWWLDANDADASLFAFARTEPNGDTIYVLINATPVPRTGYRLGVKEPGVYRELLNTDSHLYGGSNVGSLGTVHADDVPWQGQHWSLQITVPPLGAVYLARA
jgi:1,4-alpha-glucan branching enzyme